MGNTFAWFQAIQTDLALVSAILCFLCWRAAVDGWRRHRDGMLLVAGLFLQWFPLTINYTRQALIYWVEGQDYPVYNPMWIRLFVGIGFLLGSSLVFLAIQPAHVSRRGAIIAWVFIHAFMILLMVVAEGAMDGG